MNIQDFRDKIENWSSDLEDSKANSSDMQLTGWNLEFTPEPGDSNNLLASALFNAEAEHSSITYDAPMLEQARSQLASRLSIPSRWIQDLEKCPVDETADESDSEVAPDFSDVTVPLSNVNIPTNPNLLLPQLHLKQLSQDKPLLCIFPFSLFSVLF